MDTNSGPMVSLKSNEKAFFLILDAVGKIYCARSGSETKRLRIKQPIFVA